MWYQLEKGIHQPNLQIEHDTKHKTPAEDRLCTYCSLDVVEDEMHFILYCPKYEPNRKILFSKLSEFSSFTSMSDTVKFKFIMGYNDGDYDIVKLVSEFIHDNLTLRNQIAVRTTFYCSNQAVEDEVHFLLSKILISE
jgi:hypothetical protein